MGDQEQSLFDTVFKDEDEAFRAFREAFPDGYRSIVTGDACAGDEIVFGESVFTGSWRRARYAGCRVVRAKILRDSYGEKCGQHTFTLELPDGSTVRRKARNVYANWTMARERNHEEHEASLADKHERGDAARRRRELNRELNL